MISDNVLLQRGTHWAGDVARQASRVADWCSSLWPSSWSSPSPSPSQNWPNCEQRSHLSETPNLGLRTWLSLANSSSPDLENSWKVLFFSAQNICCYFKNSCFDVERLFTWKYTWKIHIQHIQFPIKNEVLSLLSVDRVKAKRRTCCFDLVLLKLLWIILNHCCLNFCTPSISQAHYTGSATLSWFST